jgi:hypothetical protein
MKKTVSRLQNLDVSLVSDVPFDWIIAEVLANCGAIEFALAEPAL